MPSLPLEDEKWTLTDFLQALNQMKKSLLGKHLCDVCSIFKWKPGIQRGYELGLCNRAGIVIKKLWLVYV